MSRSISARFAVAEHETEGVYTASGTNFSETERDNLKCATCGTTEPFLAVRLRLRGGGQHVKISQQTMLWSHCLILWRHVDGTCCSL